MIEGVGAMLSWRCTNLGFCVKNVGGNGCKTNIFKFLIKICGGMWGIVEEKYYFCNG